tara:strand:- start:3654 stop:4562 length:909 start_codon:yes stop_codon:yes gene_type:complete
MKLYKYMPYRKEFFEDPLLRLTPPSGFNDPFDSKPSEEAMAKKLAFLACEDGEECRKPTHELIKKMGPEREDIVRELKNLGIICLTEDLHNLLMWSHYADEHRGVVVEFDCSGQWLDCTPPVENMSDWVVNEFNPVPVRYSGRRPRADLDDEFIYEHGNVKFIKNTALVKSNDWIYEKEHRTIIQLSNANVVIVSKDIASRLKKTRTILNVENLPKGKLKITLDVRASPYLSCSPQEAMFFVRPKPESIRAVYFGCRFDVNKMDEVYENSEKSGHFRDVSFFRSYADDSVFGLNFKEVRCLP